MNEVATALSYNQNCILQGLSSPDPVVYAKKNKTTKKKNKKKTA